MNSRDLFRNSFRVYGARGDPQEFVPSAITPPAIPGSDPVSTQREYEDGINLAGGSSSGRRSSAAAISRIRSATDFHRDSAEGARGE